MAGNLHEYEYPNYRDLRVMLKGDFGLARKKPRPSDYLCDDSLEKNIDLVTKSVVSYILQHRKIMRRKTLGQETIRPLSILLLGPPGTGKTFFVKQVAAYMNHLFNPGKRPITIFDPEPANIAEFEHLEALGQVLIRLRNKKIDGDYPPILFLDEADADPKTFLRLLSVLWDGKFFWGEHRRDLGAMIIFLAVSSLRCKRDFIKVSGVRRVERFRRYKDCPSRKYNCSVSRWACLGERGKKEEKNAGSVSPWEGKGSDFLSRVNGPIIIFDDLTLNRGYRRRLFDKVVKERVKELHLSRYYKNDAEFDLEFIGNKKMEPRYSTRSLCLLAESLDASRISPKHKTEMITREAFSLMDKSNENIMRIHFPGLFERGA